MWGRGGFSESNFEGGGGGFLHDTSGGGHGFGSQAQDTKRSGSRSQSMMSVTVNQLVNADQDGDGFTINGKEVHQVTLIGRIVSVEESSTNIMYKIWDKTAEPLNVRKWIEVDDGSLEGDKRSECREGVMVRVTGHLRSFQGQRSMIAFGIAPVTDFNEITYHLMDVVYTHLAITKGVGGGQSKSLATGSANTEASHSHMGLSSTQNEIYEWILHCPEEAGISMEELSSKARAKSLTTHQVRQVIEFLSNEGHIYSTIDDDHFKATDG